ncbi:MAG TPA: dihydrolipoyl dehydrogenase [Blastocatellia bacterium]|nr:dihydrolipoyl dehydrogenase [Blastocatellia bacterium]
MSEQIDSTQVVVIGGGPGGYAAAFMAADLGLKVALVDLERNPGGVCLYRGCIPSKALLHVAKLINESREAASWGIEFAAPKIDVDKLRAWKESVVERLTGGLGQLGKQRKVRFIQGRAKFIDANTLNIQTGKDGAGKDGAGKDGESRLRFEHAILATGSRPATVPGLALDSPRLLDSTTALDIKSIPKSMLVIGGGYIGLELGTVYAALGAEVSVVEMTPGLLPGADRDLVSILAKRVDKIFKAVMLNSKVVEMKEERDGIRVRFEGEGIKEAEQVYENVLVSVGRKPNTEGLGLENTKVEIDPRGFVKVDAQRRTAEASIFAIGDVVGDPMLAHKATHEGRTAAEVIAGHKVAFEPNAIPAVVFTDPEIAWCGLTETDAKKENRAVTVARFPWGASGRAMTLDRTEGVTKLIIETDTGRVLGVGIVGAGAGELIAEGVLAIEMGALASDVGMSIHPHPTLSETLMEAADVFYGHSTHLYRPKREARAKSSQ